MISAWSAEVATDAPLSLAPMFNVAETDELFAGVLVCNAPLSPIGYRFWDAKNVV